MTQPCSAASTKPVGDGTIDDLHAHLQAAVDLELWTIPLYLTALYSIESDHSSIPLPPSGPDSTVTKLLASVAIQEMLHLQIAGNLAVAFGVTPELNWPAYDGSIPYISTVPEDKVIKLGCADDPEVIELIIAVETPDLASEGLPVDPEAPDIPLVKNIAYDSDGKPCYASIGDLYSVVLQLTDKFKSSMSSGTSGQFANGLFSGWYPDVASITTASVDEALNVIIDQGEGAIGEQAKPLVATDAQPDASYRYVHPFKAEDTLSHVERFTLIMEHAGGLTIWPHAGSGAGSEQQNLSAVFAQLLKNLRAAWAGGSLDLTPMFYMRAAVSQVFKSGQEVPTFAPFTGTDLASAYAAAQQALAPGDGGTWDDNVQFYFTNMDVHGMLANHEFDLSSHETVASMQVTIAGAVGPDGYMPPGGGDNLWSDQMHAAFAAWNGD